MRLNGLRVGGTLDRWIVRMYALAYVVASASCVVLFLIFDFASDVAGSRDDMGEGSTFLLLNRLARYKLLSLPDLHRLAAPFVSLAAGLYTAVRILRTREWAAAVLSGVPSARLFLPVLGGAVLFASGTVLTRESLSGVIAEGRAEALWNLDPDTAQSRAGEIWVRTRNGSPVFIRQSFVGRDASTVEGLEAPLRLGDEWGILRAREAHYVEEGGSGAWVLEDGTFARTNAKLDPTVTAVRTHPDLDFTPEDVALAVRAREEPQTLSAGEAAKLLRRDPDNNQLKVLLSMSRASPLLELGFLLMALPFVIGLEPRATARGLLHATFACCVVFAVDSLCHSLGMAGYVGSVIAVWLPASLVAFVGTALYVRQRS